MTNFEELLCSPTLSITGVEWAESNQAAKLVVFALLAYSRRQRAKPTFFYDVPGKSVELNDLPEDPLFALKLCERIIGTSSANWPKTEGQKGVCGADNLVYKLGESEELRDSLIETLCCLGFNSDRVKPLVIEAWIAYVRNLASKQSAPDTLTPKAVREQLGEQGWPVAELQHQLPANA